jgi:hypothetical protein
MTELQKRLVRACEELELRIELDVVVRLDADREVVVLARVPELGAPKGMLIVTSFDRLRAHQKDLWRDGYGFSVLSEPRANEPFDVEGWMEVFSDWGWSDTVRAKPAWMTST